MRARDGHPEPSTLPRESGEEKELPLFPLIPPEKSRVFFRWKDGDEVVQTGVFAVRGAECGSFCAGDIIADTSTAAIGAAARPGANRSGPPNPNTCPGSKAVDDAPQLPPRSEPGERADRPPERRMKKVIDHPLHLWSFL